MEKTFGTYVKELLNIAFPIIMGNLGFILIGAGDVLIAGRHSTDTLAAISIATAIVNCILTFGIGLIASVSPVLSNFRGERKAIKKYFFPTIRFSVILSIITTILILLFIPMIDYLKFESHLIEPIKQYMLISAFATFGGFLHAALKEYLQAFEIVLIPNLITVFCVVLNVILNLALVFGFGPIPSLGVVGLAIASFVVRYFMGITLLIYCFYIMKLRNAHNTGYYGVLLKVGMPISLAVLVEFIAFNSIAIIMGKVSGLYAAAQNLVCTLTTISFMVPFAVSNAIAVKVGFSNGARQFEDLKKYALIGTLISVGFMTLSGITVSLIPEVLVRLFTVDFELIKICVPVMYAVAVFQVFDGLQIALAGIFKGIKKTNVVMISNFIGYWLIAIPLGCVLAFHYGFELKGFWIGLVSAAVILCMLMLVILKKDIKKLESA